MVKLGRTLICLFVAVMGTACSSLPTNAAFTTPAATTPAVVVPDKQPVATVVEDDTELEANIVPGATPPPLVVIPDIPPNKPRIVVTKTVVAAKPVVTLPPQPKPVIAEPVPMLAVVKPPATAPPSSLIGTKLPGKPIIKDWRATTIPESMRKFFAVIGGLVKSMWPELKMPSFIMAQIEQETCISATHSKCGSTRAELKTKREYGFGIGQTTIALNKDGTERFNVWKELRDRDPILKQKWTWENRFDLELQLRALMVKDKMSYSALKFDIDNEFERLAFTGATYNSGSPLVDRRLCMAQADCNPGQWFDSATKKGVESYSVKSRVAAPGYGHSFFAISREYPYMLLDVRRKKYIPYVDKES